MFVVTADQVDSRSSPDAVDGALSIVRSVARGRLSFAPERTVGDEIQAATADPRCLLDIVLVLTRLGPWSVGCGVGSIERPAGPSVRAARGAAFIAARDAVEAAKRKPMRFALRTSEGGAEAAHDAEAFLNLLLAVRGRRTEEGWAVFDLIAGGRSQTSAAKRLKISKQAVSLRTRAAQVSTELDAIPAIARALELAERCSLADGVRTGRV